MAEETLPFEANPSDFLPDPAGRYHHVLYVPSCTPAPEEVTTAGAYEVQVGDQVRSAEAFEHDGKFYVVGSGNVYSVSPSLYARLIRSVISHPSDTSVSEAIPEKSEQRPAKRKG